MLKKHAMLQFSDISAVSLYIYRTSCRLDLVNFNISTDIRFPGGSKPDNEIKTGRVQAYTKFLVRRTWPYLLRFEMYIM